MYSRNPSSAEQNMLAMVAFTVKETITKISLHTTYYEETYNYNANLECVFSGVISAFESKMDHLPTITNVT